MLAGAAEEARVVEAKTHGRAPPAALLLGGGDFAGGAWPRRIAFRRSYSWTICIATGTATSGPDPPCSTSTATAISGDLAGAKLANQAWFWERNHAIFDSSSF